MDKQKILLCCIKDSEYIDLVADTLEQNFANEFEISKIDFLNLNQQGDLPKWAHFVECLGKKSNAMSGSGRFFYNCSWFAKSNRRMQFVYRNFFKKYVEKTIKIYQKISPDVIFSTHYFTAFCAIEYKQKINQNVKIVTYCADKKVHKLWDNRVQRFLVNNKSAWIEAIGKRGFCPVCVENICGGESESFIFEDTVEPKFSKNEIAEKIANQIYIQATRKELAKTSDLYKNMLYELAIADKFDKLTTPTNYQTALNPQKYDYFKKRGFFFKCWRGVIKSIIKIFGPILDSVAFGLKIEGRKNLKGIKSAVTFSNHIHYVDALWNMQALTHKRNVFITGGPHNMKRGFNGECLLAGGFLPLPTNFNQTKEFDKLLSQILSKGGFVHFYAEQSLWFRYEQSRPLKKGAFHYASKNNVPVVPIVILFRESKFRRKKKVILKICEPIYPNEKLSQRENCDMMKKLGQQVYDQTIIDFYGYDAKTYAYNKINLPKAKNVEKFEKNKQINTKTNKKEQ